MNETLDQKWFDKFQEINFKADFLFLEFEKDSVDKLITQVNSGRTPNFKELKNKLDYSQDFINKKLLEFEFLLKEIETEENPHVRDIYKDRIEEKILILRMLESSLNNDSQVFWDLNKQTYGFPQIKYIQIALSLIQQRNKQTYNEIKQKYFNNIPEYSIQLEFPNVSKLFNSTQQNILNNISENKDYNSNEALEVFKVIIASYSIKNWKVILSENSSVKVDQVNHTILIPKNFNRTGKSLKKLIAHEIFVHFERMINGSNQKLRLLQIGLAHYDRAEEGLALLFEGMEDKNYFSTALNYLALSIACGLSDVEGNINSVFKFLSEFSENKQKQAILNKTLRFYRGVDINLPNICYLKDIIYFEGLISIVSQLNNNNLTIQQILIGKYDCLDPKQIDQLKILSVL